MDLEKLITKIEERISELDNKKYDAIYDVDYHEAASCHSRCKEIQYWLQFIKKL